MPRYSASPPRKQATKAKAKAEPVVKTIEPQEINFGVIQLGILSRSPFLFHKKSQKAWQTLLMGGSPSRRPVDRKGILKHRPWEEFRESVYYTRDPKNPTLLLFPCSAFRQAAQIAALDTPGMAKTEIGRQLFVEGGPRGRGDQIDPERQDYVSIYGVPQITLDMVRNLGQTRAPDVRCKAILPLWACTIYVHFAQPLLTRVAVVNLMNNGGVLSGVGDGRQGKGKLSRGMFRVVDPELPEFQRVIANGGRAAQKAAMENPAPFNEETEELLRWYDDELLRRQTSGAVDIEDEPDEDELEEVC